MINGAQCRRTRASRPPPQPGRPGRDAELAGAEHALSGALGRLFALAEAYPDLKANRNMMQLSEELTSTENKVAFARQAYNDSVMGYNNRREVFPAASSPACSPSARATARDRIARRSARCRRSSFT